MEKEQLRVLLENWSNLMVRKFDGLTIRFEYNESHQCYLVSYNRLHNNEQANKFYRLLIKFERMFENDYPFNAPLFSENNRLFKLSDKAKTISKNSPAMDNQNR